ncbi:hypothetical protein CUMW_181840 [Citrus unshiu]|uniref:BED-type domain-containing protein n=1 Tax=Citrus unshiu TaxID=55188 RepID=A0A2H5PZI7_CITUN|nr:hypothetical protein CUMW_181840 [Citrus unshiu]
MSHSHFELDENFNFVEEGEEVANEEIAALEFDPTSPSGSTSSTAGPTTTSKRQRKSIVWSCFTLEKRQNKKGEMVDQAVCKYCQSALSAKSNGGIGHLRRHMETCQTKHTPQDPTQTQLSQYGSGPSGITSFRYSQQNMREGLARYIVAAEQPLTFSEDGHLINFLQRYVQPQLNKVPRNTLKRDLTKNFHDMKKLFINTFINFNGVISISSYCWTGINMVGYFCVTSHSIHEINGKWRLETKLLAFRESEYPHTGSIIYAAIMSVLREYEITDKLFSILFDNASANTAAIDMMLRNISTLMLARGSKFFHVRCVCHIINLIVQAGMTHINHYLEKIRAAILYIRALSRRQQFLETLKIFGLKRRKFNLDMKVRWNSTYLMLLSYQNYSEAISSFYNERMSDEDYHITNYDWNVFYDASLACSIVYEPTSCRVLMHLYNISYTFKTFREIIMFKNICDTMEEKFQKYWKDILHLFIFAAVLDPTIKEVGAKLLVEGKGVASSIDTNRNELQRYCSANLEDLAIPSQLQNFDIL